MPEVQLIPLGVGDAFSRLHYTTCYALGVDDTWLLIDCPHPIRKIWHEGTKSALGKALDLDRVMGVAITHLHADHASGLEDFAYYYHFGLKRRATWLAHPEIFDRLWTGLLGAGMGRPRETLDGSPDPRGLEEYVDLVPLGPSKSVPFGPFAIECRPTLHSIPTTAFRIKAGGRTLGFSADSAFDPGLIDWLSPADLIVHEATTLTESAVHTPYHHLAGLPEALRSKMLLTHLPDDFDPTTSTIDPAIQGRAYRV